jgi:hypothetical protein
MCNVVVKQVLERSLTRFRLLERLVVDLRDGAGLMLFGKNGPSAVKVSTRYLGCHLENLVGLRSVLCISDEVLRVAATEKRHKSAVLAFNGSL